MSESTKGNRAIERILRIVFVLENLAYRCALGTSVVTHKNFSDFTLRFAEAEMLALNRAYDSSPRARRADQLRHRYMKPLKERELIDFVEEIEIEAYSRGAALSYEEAFRFETFISDARESFCEEVDASSDIGRYLEIIDKYEAMRFLFFDAEAVE